MCARRACARRRGWRRPGARGAWQGVAPCGARLCGGALRPCGRGGAGRPLWWCRAAWWWCRGGPVVVPGGLVVPGVVVGYGGEHDRDPQHPADVQHGPTAEVVDRQQLTGPRMVADREARGRVAGTHPMAEHPAAGVPRPPVPERGGDQRHRGVGGLHRRRRGLCTVAEHGRAEQDHATGRGRGHRAGGPSRPPEDAWSRGSRSGFGQAAAGAAGGGSHLRGPFVVNSRL